MFITYFDNIGDEDKEQTKYPVSLICEMKEYQYHIDFYARQHIGLCRDSRKSRKHGNHENRDFRPMP